MEAEVRYVEALREGAIRCCLCPHNCRLKEGQTGVCRVRTHREGTVRSRNYGEVSSLALDPVEKKPLYHFYPGKLILSAGTWGCNLSCGFCQNYEIAHRQPGIRFIAPAELAALARDCRERGSVGVAYTYNEPLMWYEYVADTAPLVRQEGLSNVLVTNGYINKEPLLALLPFIDALNIDLKSFSDRFYRSHCRGQRGPVLETIETCAARAHVEVTTLLVTGENDEAGEINALARWLAGIDHQIPLHLSRYHPAYNFRLPPTPLANMRRARDAAREHLAYVYVGNADGFDNDTRCAHCGTVLVGREGYRVNTGGIQNGSCAACGENVPLVM